MEAVRAPYLTRPTLRGSGVRDTSLTDFEGETQEHFYRELMPDFIKEI